MLPLSKDISPGQKLSGIKFDYFFLGKGRVVKKLNDLILIIMFSLLIVFGCSKVPKEDFFEQEIDLVVKAGRNELTFPEKEALRQQGHPLLLQIGDPNTQKLLSLFAELSFQIRAGLLDKGYLKWNFVNLNEEWKQICRDLMQASIDLAEEQELEPDPDFSLEVLQESEVGFAVVRIPETEEKVISWFILLPNGRPLWITVVGARAVGTQPYANAHLAQIPLLKAMPESEPLL